MNKCSGCNSFVYSYSLKKELCKQIVFQNVPEKIIDCPCQNCLVKPVCSTPCDLFYEAHQIGIYKDKIKRTYIIKMLTKQRNK
jgi:hypothetical protein